MMCSVDGCERDVKARGYCRGHYLRVWRGGDPRASERLRPWTPENADESFWARVDTSAGPDACWPWTGGTTSAGYGVLSVRGEKVYAHRYALEQKLGRKLDPEEQTRHLVCDNPPCCNERHLAVGVQVDNMADMVAHGRHVGNRKLSEAEVVMVHAWSMSGYSASQIAPAFGVSHRAIGMIVSGDRWAHAAPIVAAVLSS